MQPGDVPRSAAASAPASSANLGPGFDCLGLALDVRCRVTATPAGSWAVRSGGEYPGADAAAFVRSAGEGAVGAGAAFRVDIDSDIPQGAGLGSSAAVAAATAAACQRAAERPVDRTRVFELVARLDGHPDNAAAAVFGGLVAAVDGRVLNLEMSPALLVVVGVPDRPLSTDAARAALPAEVSHGAAARNIGRVVALVEGLREGTGFDLAAAAGDELHEEYRAGLAPRTADLVAVARRAGALHAAWSGAGPSVLALTTSELRSSVAAALTAELGDQGSVILPDVDRAGLV